MNETINETSEKIIKRLGNCEVCNANEAKYTCPKCEVKTCSLKCVNIHKKELDCNGIRDPTKFKTLDKFNNIDLLNDYRLLENIGRVVDGLKNDRKTYKRKFDKGKLPKYLTILKIALYERNIGIKFLSEGFERRKNNKTHIHRPTREIRWDVDWIFPNADNLKIHENNCSENKKLSSLLNKYFQNESEVLNRQLKYYQSAGMSGVVLFLKAENIKNDKYYELDLQENLRDNLKNKYIIEYPIIHIVLKGHEGLYSVVDINDEKAEIKENNFYKKKKCNEGDRVILELLKEETKEDSKNFLFNTEYTDSDSGDEK